MTECENIKKNYEDRVDKFYEKEKELDERVKREEPRLRNFEEQIDTWRKITRILSCKLRKTMNTRDYMGFVSEFPSYYGL